MWDLSPTQPFGPTLGKPRTPTTTELIKMELRGVEPLTSRVRF